MSGRNFDDELDVEMDERLKAFARGTREPALPDDIRDLPWKVQNEPTRTSLLGSLREMGGGLAGLRRTAFAFGRLSLTLAVAGSFLLLVGNVRTSGSGTDLIQPPPGAAVPSSGAAAAPTGPEVVLVPTSGVVDSVMADHVAGAVHRAETDGAAAVVIQLDTLGGSLSAMQSIVKSLDSKVPTIVWVGPRGAKAASAGTFITLAANLDYMAPSTNIGAASPVAANGADISATYGQTEADKTMQDAIKTITSIAQDRHPKAVAWAVTTVQSAQSYSAEEAVAAQGVNGIAANIDDVIAQADGQTVTTSAGQVVVHTKGAAIMTINEDYVQSILHTLDDPNIAFVLLVLGVLLIAIELFHPTLLMGLAGALCLALSFYGSGDLPLNVLGVVLVVLGIGMMVLEPNLPTHGALTVGGICVFVVGAVAFYGSPGPYLPAVGVAWPVIGIMAVGAALYGLVVVTALIRLRNQPVPVGAGLVGIDGVIGQIGIVQADLAPIGTVYVGREAWSARAEDGTEYKRGDKVEIVRQEGLTLIAKRLK
jgi:membrane-bound serine protease (ClpP class)